jgi:hypothetical protein
MAYTPVLVHSAIESFGVRGLYEMEELEKDGRHG